MSGVNTGILTNAFPLTAEQVSAIENRVLETGETIVFLNETKELCYAMPFNPELIRELAWHHAYELTEDNGVLNKKVYEKDSLETFHLSEVLQKTSIDDSWNLVPTFISILDEGILNEFILE